MAILNWYVNRFLNFGAAATQYRITGSMTISAWVLTSIFTQNQYIMNKSEAANSLRAYYLFIQTNGIPCFQVANSTTTVISSPAATGIAVTSGVWTHVAGIMNGSTVAVYVNGDLSGETAWSGTQQNPTSVALAVGVTRPTNPAQQFNGTLFDVRLYNRALSIAECKEIHAAKGRDSILDSSLVLRTCIKDGYAGSSLSGSTVYDHSAFKNHVTPTGALNVAADPYPTTKAPILIA